MLDAGSTSKQLAQPTNEVACHASPLASGRRLLMSRQSFVVLTEDEQFAAVLRSVLRGAVVMVASCLDQIPDRFSEYRLIVDPLSVRECCLESIRRMRRGRPVGSVSAGRRILLPPMALPLLE